ncbi:MAG: anaerobic sulfatase maturase [Oscillospiraceae bacterium]
MLIKPASSTCNLHCKYCFYSDVAHNRENPNYGFMSSDTLDSIMKKVFQFATIQCSFGFQGGEPTLAGLDFYKNVVALQKKYNQRGIAVHNAIQTNGYIIDADWAEFLAENNFLVGLSLDGTKEIHNTNRVDFANEGTFTKVMKTAELLNAYKVEYNILTVVTSQVARHITEIYNFYKKNNFIYQQYIPCLDPLGVQRGSLKYSLTPELFEKFLNTLFELWYRDISSGSFVYNRYFENLIGMLAGYKPESCGTSGVCSNQLIIEANGDVFPCDFYVIDKYKLGNINDMPLCELAKNRTSENFIAQSMNLTSQCRECKWLSICHGGCRRDRDCWTEIGQNYYCQSYKGFFQKNIGKLLELSKTVDNPNKR